MTDFGYDETDSMGSGYESMEEEVIIQPKKVFKEPVL